MCKVNDIKVNIGDDVCIGSDDGEVLVARIQELYESQSIKKDRNRAKVLWYFTPCSLPSSVRKKLPSILDRTVKSNELFFPLDGIDRSYDNVRFTEDLDAETIVDKCQVTHLKTHENILDDLCNFDSEEFFVQYRFDERFNFIPVVNTANQLKAKSCTASSQTSSKLSHTSSRSSTVSSKPSRNPSKPSGTPSRCRSALQKLTENKTPKNKMKEQVSQTPSRSSQNPSKTSQTQSKSASTPSRHCSALQELTENRKSKTRTKKQEQDIKFGVGESKKSDSTTQKLSQDRTKAESQQKSSKRIRSAKGRTSVKMDSNNNTSTPLKRKASRSVPDESVIDRKRNKPHPPVKEWVSPKLGGYSWEKQGP